MKKQSGAHIQPFVRPFHINFDRYNHILGAFLIFRWWPNQDHNKIIFTKKEAGQDYAARYDKENMYLLLCIYIFLIFSGDKDYHMHYMEGNTGPFKYLCTHGSMMLTHLRTCFVASSHVCTQCVRVRTQIFTYYFMNLKVIISMVKIQEPSSFVMSISMIYTLKVLDFIFNILIEQ